jgi:hypothetical protein
VFSPAPTEGVFRQGEIVSDVIQVHLRADSLAADAGDVDLEEKIHPYALILTQDCDLDWDFKASEVFDLKPTSIESRESVESRSCRAFLSC